VDAAFRHHFVIRFNEVFAAACGSVQWFMVKWWFRNRREARISVLKGKGFLSAG